MLLCVTDWDAFWRSVSRRCLNKLAGTAASLLLAATSFHSQGQAAGDQTANCIPRAGQAVEITLEKAIRLAQASEPAYAAARAASRSAALDKSIAVAGLLPNARFYNQDIYTQPNGLYAEGGEGVSSPNPKFVANDSRPREYIAQGIAEETLGFAGPAAVRHADAAAAMAVAEQEIARRGLVATVTRMFYTSLAAGHKLVVAERARLEATEFTKQTTEREQAREAAHADVVKAQLVEQQRERDFEDAGVADEKARLDLGVLLFSDPRTPYTLQAPALSPLPSQQEVEQAAAKNNPELKSALASLAASNADVQSAWGALLPSAVLNVTYGIDANEFAANGPLLNPDGLRARNLGYSTSVTVNLPVWDWLAGEHKLKQSQIRRDAAQVALTNMQRRMVAELEEAYDEARSAQDQLQSLDQSVATAEESLRLTKLRYSAGEGTVLEVVDAETAYVTAEDAREDGRVRYETARAELATIAGTM